MFAFLLDQRLHTGLIFGHRHLLMLIARVAEHETPLQQLTRAQQPQQIIGMR